MDTKVYCTYCFCVWLVQTIPETCPYCKEKTAKIKIYTTAKKVS